MDIKSRGFKKHGNMCKIKNTRIGTKFKYGKKVIKHNKNVCNKKHRSVTARIGIKSLIDDYDDVSSKERSMNITTNNAKRSRMSEYIICHTNTTRNNIKDHAKMKPSSNTQNGNHKSERVDVSAMVERYNVFGSFAEYISSFFY